MRRTILTSLLIIGASLAVVFGGGIFSAFSDTESLNGTASAGTLGIKIVGDGDTGDGDDGFGELDISFDASPCGVGINFFAPDESCSITVTVSRGEPGTPTAFLEQLAANLAFSGFQVTYNPGALVIVDNDVNDVDDPDATVRQIGIECDATHTGKDWTITVGNFADSSGSPGGDTAGYLPAGANDTETFIITVKLEDVSGTGCQDSDLLIELNVDATQDNLPHNTLDIP